jgi:hypothetical protein
MVGNGVGFSTGYTEIEGDDMMQILFYITWEEV